MRKFAKTMAVAFLLGVAAGLLMLALTGCSEGDVGGWPASAEFSTLETGQSRFSSHDTGLGSWRVIVDHETGAQYLAYSSYRYGAAVCPLLDVDGTPLLVLEAGE